MLLVTDTVLEGLGAIDAGVVSVGTPVVVLFGVLLWNSSVADLAVKGDHRDVSQVNIYALVVPVPVAVVSGEQQLIEFKYEKFSILR